MEIEKMEYLVSGHENKISALLSDMITLNKRMSAAENLGAERTARMRARNYELLKRIEGLERRVDKCSPVGFPCGDMDCDDCSHSPKHDDDCVEDSDPRRVDPSPGTEGYYAVCRNNDCSECRNSDENGGKCEAEQVFERVSESLPDEDRQQSRGPCAGMDCSVCKHHEDCTGHTIERVQQPETAIGVGDLVTHDARYYSVTHTKGDIPDIRMDFVADYVVEQHGTWIVLGVAYGFARDKIVLVSKRGDWDGVASEPCADREVVVFKRVSETSCVTGAEDYKYDMYLAPLKLGMSHVPWDARIEYARKFRTMPEATAYAVEHGLGDVSFRFVDAVVEAVVEADERVIDVGDLVTRNHPGVDRWVVLRTVSQGNGDKELDVLCIIGNPDSVWSAGDSSIESRCWFTLVAMAGEWGS